MRRGGEGVGEEGDGEEEVGSHRGR
jgi:hypothetical protein